MISNRMTLERVIEHERTEIRRRIKRGHRTPGDVGESLGGNGSGNGSGSGNGNGLYDHYLGAPGMGAMIGSSDIESPGENKFAEGSPEERRRKEFRRQFMDRSEGEEVIGVVRENGADVQQGIPDQPVLEEEEKGGMLGHFDVEQTDLDADDGLRNDGEDEDENDWSDEEEEEEED